MDTINSIEDFAEAILERPSDAAFWDERLYTSHGPIYAWAERGEDILVESNYRSILDYLMQFTEHENADEDVIDASISHWAVGSLRQLFVRVYDEDGNHTPVFIAAWEVYEALESYPVWDESDYSELETEYTGKAYEAELEYLMAHDDDFPDELEGDLAVTLRILWEQNFYGYNEPGYVNSGDIKALLPEAQAIETAHLANLNGATTLDMPKQ